MKRILVLTALGVVLLMGCGKNKVETLDGAKDFINPEIPVSEETDTGVDFSEEMTQVTNRIFEEDMTECYTVPLRYGDVTMDVMVPIGVATQLGYYADGDAKLDWDFGAKNVINEIGMQDFYRLRSGNNVYDLTCILMDDKSYDDCIAEEDRVGEKHTGVVDGHEAYYYYHEEQANDLNGVVCVKASDTVNLLIEYKSLGEFISDPKEFLTCLDDLILIH